MIYLVGSGLVKLFKMSTDGKEQILRLGHPGDCFGRTGIFNGSSNPESTQAVVPFVLYELINSDLEILPWEHKQLALNTIKTPATKMQHYITLAGDLSLRRISDRLARLLLEHSSEEIFDDSFIFTRGDTVSMTGTMREIAGNPLKALEENRIILFNNHHITIRDSDALGIMADLAQGWRYVP